MRAMRRVLLVYVWLPILVMATMLLGACAIANEEQETNLEQETESQTCETVVFSDARYIEEAGDVVGTEIVLRLCRDSDVVTGQWDEYQGYNPETTHLSGTLQDTTLQMRAPEERLRPILQAELEDATLRGELKWSLGNSLGTKNLNLLRVPGRWEDLRREGQRP